MRIQHIAMMSMAAVAGVSGLASAATIGSGSATFTINEGQANVVSTFNAYFNESATRSQTLSDAAPGNAAWTRTGTAGSGTVSLVDTVRPSGVTPTTGDGRTRQTTTLDIDPANILGTWSASDNGFGFAGGTTLGEQIALTGMQRFTGPFTGSLLYGDFALRYVPGRANATRSGLVLTSNIDFLNASFADIGNASISVTNGILQIDGRLLTGEALTLLGSNAATGTDFGSFSLTAAVPEPASLGLLGVGGLALLRRRRA